MLLSAPKGLGDAIYLRAVVLHLLERGEAVTVFTPWRAAFADLPIKLEPFDNGVDRPDVARVRYQLTRANPEGSTNFEAACRYAGFEPVELRMGWSVRNVDLIERIKREAAGRKIFVYQPRKFARNEEQHLLRPRRGPYNKFVADHRKYFRIKLGQPGFIDDDNRLACELNLFGKASISDAFDIISIADLCFGESCYVPMTGEAMDKRFAVMFTRRALNSNSRQRYMTPERLFHKKHLATAVYDES